MSKVKWSELKWKSLSHVQLFVTPMDYTVHKSLQARILEWIAIPFSRGSSQPGDWTQVSHIVGQFFTSWATREVWSVPIQVLSARWGGEDAVMLIQVSCPPQRYTPVVMSRMLSEFEVTKHKKHWWVGCYQNLRLQSIRSIDKYTLLHWKWVTNEVLLCSTENSAQCYMAAWMGGQLEENGYPYMYDWVPLLFTWNYHNVANWLLLLFTPK